MHCIGGIDRRVCQALIVSQLLAVPQADRSIPNPIIVVEDIISLRRCHPHRFLPKVKLLHLLILEARTGLQVRQAIEHHHH